MTPIAARKMIPLRDRESIVSHIDNRWYKHSRQYIRRYRLLIRNRNGKEILQTTFRWVGHVFGVLYSGKITAPGPSLTEPSGLEIPIETWILDCPGSVFAVLIRTNCPKSFRKKGTGFRSVPLLDVVLTKLCSCLNGSGRGIYCTHHNGRTFAHCCFTVRNMIIMDSFARAATLWGYAFSIKGCRARLTRSVEGQSFASVAIGDSIEFRGVAQLGRARHLGC